MKIKHMIIEGYCNVEENLQESRCDGTFAMGIHCIGCPQFSYAEAPNELAYSNGESVVENENCFIGFGGKMDCTDQNQHEQRIGQWDKICKEAISDAYEVFINAFEETGQK